MSPIKPWVAVAALLTTGAGAKAHEYIVLPDRFSGTAGTSTTVRALSSHVFFAAEELEDPADSTACLWKDNARTPVPLAPDEKKTSFVGTAMLPSDGTVIICGARKAQIWATTQVGVKRGTRKEFPNATLLRSIEKFSKAIINAIAGDETWSRPIGDRLEIVPKANPATVKVGDELPVQVLYDGKPLSTQVWATHGGFSSRYMTFAYYTEMENTDIAHIRITKPGVWIVRVEHTDSTRTEAYDRYVARAVLMFEIKE